MEEDKVARTTSNVETDPVPTKENDQAPVDARPEHSALPESHRAILLAVVSLAASIAPASTTTYYPAITALSRHLKVSITQINLTISTYQIFQGIAPTVAAAFADRYGRRPVYLVCLSLNVAANLGMALHTTYTSLLVLRCIQSGSGSGTVTLGQAVLDDLTTSEQRGKFMAYLSIGYVMGPALGPVIGGLLSHFLGWRAIFWFLMIFAGVFLVATAIFFRETNRSIVGDGSVAPQRWNRSIVQLISKGNLVANSQTLEPKLKGVNLLGSLQILRNRENLIICIYGGIVFAGYASVISVFAPQLEERYNYNQVQVGLCFLPLGIGSLLSRWTAAKLVDWNFKREAGKHGMEVVKNRAQDLSGFNIEKTRLIISFPLIVATSALLIVYGWLMEYSIHVSSVLVISFLIGNVFTGAMVANTVLLTDINPGNGASLGAATNLTRSLLAAGGVAASTPLINKFGIGYTTTLIAGLYIAGLPALWVVYRRGHAWRKAQGVWEAGEMEGERSGVPPAA